MSTNHGSGRDHTVIDIFDDHEKSKECIFRVPNVLLRQNQKHIHLTLFQSDLFIIIQKSEARRKVKEARKQWRKIFQLMERVKTRYLNEILTDMKNITLEELTTEVIKLSDQKNEGEFEKRARDFYAEPLDHISSEEFIKMMIVDGCFLIQLFQKCNDKKLRALHDPVFNMDHMFHSLCHDILLLENQLPWFVIHSLYSLFIGYNVASLSSLVLRALSLLPSLKQSCSSYSKHLLRNNCHCDADYLHILDLVRASIVIPLRTIEERAHKAAGNSEEHEVHSGKKTKVVHEAIFDPDLHLIRTATALSKADIKFERVYRDSIMDIRFRVGGWFRNGILEIPRLNIGMSSETLFRNLIAIEQCFHGYSDEITSYVIFMDNLIFSKEDMKLLREERVIAIDNQMTEFFMEDRCKFLSNLCKNIRQNKFYYAELCRKVLPTILQTTFAIKQYYYPQK